MKIALSLNPTKQNAIDCLQIVLKLCDKYCIQYSFIEDYPIVDTKDAKSLKGADFLVTLGGDGTILYAAKKKLDLPILGINLGRLGLLTEIQIDELEKSFLSLIGKDFKLETRSMLSACVKGQEYDALNDIVLYREGRKIIDLDIKVSGVRVGNVRADGIIVCTPTGSTAYSLVAGGSVISNDTNVFGITPLGSQGLGARPLIVGDNNQITITVEKELARLECDGNKICVIDGGKEVSIKKSKQNVSFVRFKNGNYYKKLNSKFGIWGTNETI